MPMPRPTPRPISVTSLPELELGLVAEVLDEADADARVEVALDSSRRYHRRHCCCYRRHFCRRRGRRTHTQTISDEHCATIKMLAAIHQLEMKAVRDRQPFEGMRRPTERSCIRDVCCTRV